ncbi:MAG: RDD family protein [Nocardioides sp.]|uniref:RDD family protein n=1 Tax=Nocardioides sp. TaxID=35761 RepID=UPI0039E67B15
MTERETASWVRRGLALMVDWIASTLVAIVIVGLDTYRDDPSAGFVVLGVYVVESAILCAVAGGSFGQLATRLRVVRNDGTGRPLSLLAALVRSVLIALLIPPLVFRPDGRGLHDLAVGSVTIALPRRT